MEDALHGSSITVPFQPEEGFMVQGEFLREQRAHLMSIALFSSMV